ncbi:MAG TPA: hypothetical protein VIU41_10055 [Geobacteraceae bacterium]
MKKTLGFAALCLALAGSVAALADDEQVPTEKEVIQAEGMPPTIPHKVKESDAKHCLKCHEKGKKGAPVTPHPERRTCTECHIPSSGFDAEHGGKKK